MGVDWLGGRLPRVYLFAVFSLFPLALILDRPSLAGLRGRRRALGFLPLPRLRIRLAKSNVKDGFRVLGS